MDNIFKRFTCLFLALLMILEVFSPVTALAAGLVDDTNYENSNSNKVEKKISDELFNKPAEKTSQKDTRKTNSNKKEEVHKNSSNKPKETGKAPELIPAKKTKNDYEFFENTQKSQDNQKQAEEKAKAEAEAKAAEEAKAKEEQAAKENAELEKQKQELLRIEAEKQAQAARANEAEAAAAEAEYRDARQKRIELEKLLEEKLKEKGLRDQQKQESEKSLNQEKLNKLEDKKLEEEVAEEEEEKGLLEKIKEGLGLTDLQKADKELKKALANKENGLEEIQALLNTFQDKYDLSREDQEKLMADNTDAFREFVEKRGYENFDPQMFMIENGLGENEGLEIADLYSNRKGILIPQPLTPEEEAIGLQIIEEYRTEEKQEEDSHGFMFFRAPARGPQNNLADKKYTIITRFDTSNAGGPIKVGQSFTIKLDERLTVNDPKTLKPIVYNGKTIANPSYDENANSIKYTIAEAISDNLQIPLAIDVDYNVKNIQDLDGDATKHSIKNSITGIGVTKAVKLPETVVDNDGNVVNQIIEPGSKDVLQIVDQGKDYQVHMDVSGSPIVKDGELESIDWTVRYSSTKDLLDLGLISNATLVKGSGLSRYENITINGKPINLDDITTNEIEGKLGIRESKNHTLKEHTKDVVINFQTPVFNKQQKYMIDFSVLLKNRKKSGAVRLLFDKGYTDEQVKEKTSKRIGMNNRTTIMGEFTSENTARWTVTDGVSTGDANKGLPIATRDLTGTQDLTSSKMAVYAIDTDPNSPTCGKMVIKTINPDDDGGTAITGIPAKESNPNTAQAPGTIAVYEYDTALEDSNAGYSLAGVNLNKYQDVTIKQTWAGIDSTKKMPAQGFVVKDENGKEISPEIKVSEGETGKSDREITIPAAKYWTIETEKTPEGQDVVKEKKTNQKIVQTLPQDTTIGGTRYSYKEKYNYLAEEDGAYHIYNVMTESTQEKDADFAIIKFDSKDPSKKLSGAKFTLQSPKETIELVTDANGRASFSNVSPGTYTLIENKAPNGYKLDTTAKQIRIDNDGKVSVSGDNIAMQGGKIETELDHHQYYPNYPSYMNALHYGKIDKNGNIEFYIHLKPEANGNDGYTNKDTRLNLNVLGGTIKSVEVLDVGPGNRDTVKNYMYNQTADQYTGANLLNAGGANDITGKDNITDGYTGKTGYQVKFPAARFGGQDGDWGFLVKVKATGSESTAVSYDWLTDNNRVKDEARIQKSIGLSTSAESGVMLNIANEPFPKLPVEVTKIKQDKSPLANATFRLKDSKGNIISDAKSGDDGKASFGELSPGDYIIEEISAPSGYQKSQVIFDVHVGEDGKVIYNARFKDGAGTPKNGVDYILEEIEAGQEGGKATVTGITQSMILQEKQTQPNDGRLGWQEGIWEAYFIESYRYKADFLISNASKGGLFKIQFDPNLDFRRYVYEIPELKDAEGNVLAKPYFNYETNLLTYQFTNNIDSNAVNAHLEIIGIIPDKYYATQTNKTTGYNFRIVIDPDNTTGTSTPTVEHPNISTTISHDKVLPVNIKTDYYAYDSSGGGGPLTSEYIYDIYTDEKGDTYLKAMSYYNPTGLDSNKRTLRYDWISMNKPVSDLNTYRANGYPAFGFQELEVYKVTDTPANKQKLMPLSYGIRPDQDPRNYDLVYSKNDVNPEQGFRDQVGDYRITYDPSKLKSTELLTKDGHNNHPLEIDLPRVGKNEGYVVIQTFKVTDEQRYKNLWTGYYLSNGSRQTGSYQKGNANHAIGSETGQEIPKFYTERVKLFNKTYNPGQFKIEKLNEADRTKKLQGATFSLTDGEGNVIYRSSDAQGIVDFTDIEPGTYTLEESEAPDGYTKSTKKWRVTVYDTGNVLIREIGITGTGSVVEGTTIKLPVTNKPVGEKFQVYKKNGNGQALQGAEFTIYEKDEKTVVATGISNANGIVDFKFADGKSLEEGQQYILKETKQPQGYKPINKKWVLEVKDGKTKVYNYVASTESTDLKSFLAEDNVNWVDVKNRNTTGWSTYDNRWTGWTGNSKTAQYMGTRIIAINKIDGYAIQRYVINPEARNIGETTATIHREKPGDSNMTWYNGSADYKVFELDKPVTGLVSDLRLANYTTTDITKNVTADKVPGRFNEPDRLQLTLPKTSKPIVIDVKVPYDKETGGVGTGMDWTESGTTYWKSDYYERVSDIVVGDPTKAAAGDIKGSYISEGSLDVTNEKDKFQFKLKKVKDGTTNPIQGAVFKLTGPDPSTNTREMTTGADGMITFAGLEAGTYTLEETQPAPGYEKVNNDWTVRITVDGKAYIKDNNPSNGTTGSTETPASTFSIVDLGSKDTAEALSINPELAMKMQRVKALAYGAEDELNSKSLVFMTEADKNEELVKENLASVYGSDVITNKYSDIVTDKEVGMATYSLDSLGTNVGGLEINPETKPEAQRAGTWEVVDLSRSEIPTEFKNDGNLSKITEINKTENRIRQRFIVNLDGKYNTDKNIKPAFEIYQEPDKGVYGAHKNNLTYSVKKLKAGSTIDKPIVLENAILGAQSSFKPNDTKPYRYRIILNQKISTPIMLEVEGPYDENNRVGLGINYHYNGWDKADNQWVAHYYNNESDVNTKYKITVGPTTNGSVNAPESAKVGADINLTVNPNDGYELDKLIVDGQDVTQSVNNNQYTFKMPSHDVNVQASFKKIPVTKYTVSFDSNNGSGTMDQVEVEANKTYTLPANGFTPPSGKEFKAWSVKGVEYQPGASIKVNANTTVTALWKVKASADFNVTVQNPQQEGGTISAEPTSAAAGTTVNLTVKPKENYQIESVTMNGKALTAGADGKYSFTMPAGDVTVTATFKKTETPDQPGQGETEIPAGKAVQITNKQVGIELKVHKINNVNEGLEGAEFTLKKYTDETFTNVEDTFEGLTATSDEQGKVEFKDAQGQIVKLNPGYYMLEETKSPVGYKKQAAPWKLQVKEENGYLKIIQNGPAHTAASFLTSDKAVAADNQTGTIKYKSIIKNIDPDSKTFIQRVYIDTRDYGKVVNVQITPKHKREEIDRPGLPPVTIEEGVKTAYRSTYQITNPPTNVDVDKVLNSYDLRDPNVKTVNTARWRPFDWGFDEDLLNLEPGVYYIDIEGYYDTSIVDKNVTNEVAIDSNYNFTEKDETTPSAEPVIKDPYVRDDIPEDDLGKLDLHIDFYDGAREFQEINDVSNLVYKHFDQGSYQHGATTIRNWIKQRLIQKGYNKDYAESFANDWANKKLPGQKYANALSKKVKINESDTNWIDTGRINPSVAGTPVAHADTSLDISSLYTSDTPETVPQDGMAITNEREVYNITFSKHSKEEDDNKNRLEGAVFKLQKKEGSFWYDLDESYVSSAFNGYFGFRRLEPGTYRLLEVAPPKGYRAIDGTLLEFVIKTIDPKGETFTKDGKTYDKESGLQVEIQPDGTHKVVDPDTGKIVESANGYVTIEYNKKNYLIPNVKDDETSTGKLVDFVTSATAKNIGKVINEEPGKGSVTIKKVDEKGNAISGKKNESGDLIAGAKFKATRLGAKTDENGNPVADAVYEGTVGEDGTLKFEGLPLGNYELREVESPNGYINTGQVWHFTVGGKGLDPYAEDASPRTRNITSLIELTSSKMIVDRPAGDENTGNEEIQPHIGESLQFTNDYKIKDGVKISAGDYFTLKLTDNMDLYGIREDEPTNLDLFADGIGTIAKADYNGQAGTITYTFTKAAEQYTITDFKNVMATHINLYRVRNSGNQKVGMSIGNDTSKYKDIYVNYIVDTEKDDDGYNFINMASKIVSFNSKTGEFVHYFYINREGEYDGRNLTFRYRPNQKVNDLQITTYDLYYTDNNSKIQSMPASFGVNENDRNLWRSGITQPKTVEANNTTTTNIGAFPNNRAAIVKVTGRIDTNDLTLYKGYSALYYGYSYTDNYGYQRWAEYPSVYRWDGVYVFENESTAQANFELKITNPSNKVVFEKVNTEGQVLKPTVDETGKVTKGAKFTLEKNDGTIENPSTTWTAKTNPTFVDKDGRISYNHLDKGLYRLIENQAPEGYANPNGPVAYLKVDDSGRIYQKITVPNAEGTGTTEIYQEVSETIPIKVVNNKPIEFVKVDADDNGKILPGAEFKVLYKEKEEGKYDDYKVDGQLVTVKSDDKGKFSLNVPKDGYYALEETKAPDGYSKFPGYIKEFKLESGKIQVLEKDPLKASFVKGANNMITSEILEVDKDKGTFKQRLVINPGHTQWTFDKYDTLLQLDVNNWNVSDKYRTIKVATLEKDKTVADLKDKDFKEVNPRNQQYSTNPLIYSIPSLYNSNDYTQPNPKISNIVTEKGLVVEITGKITDKTKAVDLKPEVYSRAFTTSIDKVNYKLDINNMSEGKGIYLNYQATDPIQVENRKGQYPLTGGRGTLIFTLAGLVLMSAAAYVYSRKRGVSYDE
ncbi:SpaA isopeptide-forming pilin-related protein [Peptoniphilus harei]|uniref:Fibrinogen-binding adhesin SdrG C-terminal domain-containing protein n=1 Tax=Peptoniphilus harei TaxID=54005 RepID=A0A943SQK3_9FIRM|nr:SpaA isopeptide-forming pilin-related protein [Peptoniphilus harei]MBS6534799.1 fibrinogen-binding adhesin SdrG C-terminal domain-containing protein [Peptoniphilus harei]